MSKKIDVNKYDEMKNQSDYWEIEFNKKDLECTELQKQLAEKDKRIDELEQEREFMLDEVKNRGTCGLCEKLEEKAINGLRDKLKEKDKEIADLHTTINQDAVEIMMLKDYIEKRKNFIDERIVEKDKEIEKLTDLNNFLTDQNKDLILDMGTDKERIMHKYFCHQICEKIREWYREQELIMEEWLIDCLDQIEKGGEKE